MDWLSRATNWAKLSATASLGVIHRGHEKDSLALMQVGITNQAVFITRVSFKLLIGPRKQGESSNTNFEFLRKLLCQQNGQRVKKKENRVLHNLMTTLWVSQIPVLTQKETQIFHKYKKYRRLPYLSSPLKRTFECPKLLISKK